MAQESNINSIVPDENQEGTTVVIDRKTGTLQYQSEDPVSARLTQQVGFNKGEGALNFVRGNGEVLTIPGFFTESQLGVGPRGQKGARGKNGKDGRLGRDGKEGKTGCEGEVGAKGIIGDDGLDGDDGDRGITGLYGCPGGPGLTGLQGIPGIVGLQGPMGKSGASCIVGERGIQGPEPSGDVYYGEDEPAIEYYLWAVPTEEGTVIPDPVEEPDPMSGNVDDQEATLALVSDDYFNGSVFMVLRNFSGGIGPFTYQWRWDAGTIDGTTLALGSSGSTGRTLEITAYTLIDPEGSITISGEVWLEITDTGDADKTYTTDRGRFTFTGNNPRQDDGADPDPGGPIIIGGGGCIHQYTPIQMFDGSIRHARDVQVGDVIWGYAIEGVIDESVTGWEEWTTNDLQGERAPVTVVANQPAEYKEYWVVNSDLRITKSHNLLVQQNGVWGWHDVEAINVGDYLWGEQSPVEVTSVVKMEQSLRVAVIDVEEHDVYYAGNTPVLVHNNDARFQKH